LLVGQKKGNYVVELKNETKVDINSIDNYTKKELKAKGKTLVDALHNLSQNIDY
jgi:hypothetical protein